VHAEHPEVSEHDAGTQLTEDCRLIQSDGYLTSDLRHQDHYGEDQPDRGV
jgi:hypothetical protein